MRYTLLTLIALSFGCGDDPSPKRTQADEPTQAELRNRQSIDRCQACNGPTDCYCWWMMVDGEPECVEVEPSQHFRNLCDEYEHDEMCRLQPYNTTCE